jgi:hypothetical protein
MAASPSPLTQPIYRITSFERLEPYVLKLRLDDATEQVVDFEPILSGEQYGPLRDSELFDQIGLDTEVHTLTWPTGADFDPATSHDWPLYREAAIERAQQWNLRAA